MENANGAQCVQDKASPLLLVELVGLKAPHLQNQSNIVD